MAFSPREILALDQRAGQLASQGMGVKRMQTVLGRANTELAKRLEKMIAKHGSDTTFTTVQMRATLKQIREVIRGVQGGMKDTLLATGEDVAELSAKKTLRYLTEAEKAFKGIAQPLALNEAAIVDQAQSGVNSTILRRLGSSGESAIEGAAEVASTAKVGILERYGMSTFGHFEDVLQQGFIQRKSFAEVTEALTESSPFLQSAPGYWAERIVRTEVMGTYSRASWETIRSADQDLGDMIKILSATFDNRTASDSYAVHGQIRRPEEAFETWYGNMQHPPARPNDREIVVPHRLSWPIPPYLKPRSDGEVVARWKMERRKGAPPARPLMSTVDASAFAKSKDEPKKRDDG